jgi:hypothetical protein
MHSLKDHVSIMVPSWVSWFGKDSVDYGNEFLRILHQNVQSEFNFG